MIARAGPEDKLRVVSLLQQQRRIVAVTGDSTSDAPSLNKADVGIAMGISGTEIAKEASDIIIMNDSFEKIVQAIVFVKGKK